MITVGPSTDIFIDLYIPREKFLDPPCRWFPLAALCVAVPLSALAEEKKEGWHLLDLDIRRKTFFKYVGCSASTLD